MSISHRKEQANAALQERIRQRLCECKGDVELTYARQNTNLSSYEQWEYRNTDPATKGIERFYNLYKGQRCFIIGNGPSLNRHDLSLLEGEKVFAVNSFYYKTRETGFKPTFFVVEDEMVMKENCEQFVTYDVPYKFFPTEYKIYHPPGPNVYYFRMNHGFYQNGSPYYNLPRFSSDPIKGVYCGQSVTYINLQMAFFMGFSDVYLIGMDFNYVIPKEHKRKGNDIISTTDDPNHFHKDYFGVGKTWRDPKLDRVLINYRMADLAYSAVGRKIYNATIGGKLEIFDRVDYEVLLRDPSTGLKRSVPILPPITAQGSLARQHGHNSENPNDNLAARQTHVPINPSKGHPVAPILRRGTGNHHGQLEIARRLEQEFPILLSSQLLLDPEGMLPLIEQGGELYATAQALLNQGGEKADHFARILELARRKCSRSSSFS